ncbi:MAG: helix-turn-helix domain-containing protein [Eubacterium ventriosum]
MILAEKISEERKKNGWSQEELAEKLSVSTVGFKMGKWPVSADLTEF